MERNGVKGRVRIRKGGVGRIQKKFDFILANVDFKGLKRLRIPLLRHLSDKGVLILSGILREEEDKICRLYLESNAIRLIEIDHKGEWMSLTFKKEG